LPESQYPTAEQSHVVAPTLVDVSQTMQFSIPLGEKYPFCASAQFPPMEHSPAALQSHLVALLPAARPGQLIQSEIPEGEKYPFGTEPQFPFKEHSPTWVQSHEVAEFPAGRPGQAKHSVRPLGE